MKPILSSDCSLGQLSQQVGKTLHDNGGHKGKANTHTTTKYIITQIQNS